MLTFVQFLDFVVRFSQLRAKEGKAGKTIVLRVPNLLCVWRVESGQVGSNRLNFGNCPKPALRTGKKRSYLAHRHLQTVSWHADGRKLIL